MNIRIRNDQVALAALLVLGGDRAPIDTENIAMEADRLAPGRFRWRKFKEHIDLGLVRNGLQDARKKGLVDGGAHRGWVLTSAGMQEASSLLPELADPSTRERVATDQRQWESRERTRLLAEPAFHVAVDEGTAAVTTRDALRLFKLDEYTSPERRSERLRRFTLLFDDDPELGRVVGELIRRLQMNKPEQLAVTTHVGRDILQSADLFRHPERVVWEYVVNGLEYTDPGTSPRVVVSIQSSPRRITIADNGRGMDRAGLVQFFTMHAENTDRVAGKPGRGFFGTGKSAAFAIANVLRLDTVRNGRRSIVELHRSDVEATSSGDPVPVQTIQMEAATDSPNGTIVTITDFRVSRVNRGDIVRLIERNLRHMGRGVSVVVDGSDVEPHVPPIAESRAHKLSSTVPELNGAELTLHVAKAPLVEEDRGVAILSNGNLHEITLGTARGKSMAQYIFGEIDIPALAKPHKGVAAYDMSRSGQLNPENELVLGLYAEISRYIEALRSELVERENIRKRAEEAEKLQSQADEIARFINQDYLESSKRFRREQADGGHGDDLRKAIRETEIGDSLFVPGGDEPATPLVEDIILNADTDRPVEPDPREPEPAVEPSTQDEAETTGHSQPATPSKRHPSGGFKVQFRENGSESPRAFYEKETRIIYINLDHPQVMAAKGDGDTDEPTFQRLSYEIAFTEYAIGLAKDYADNHYYSDFDEPLFDIRDRIDRLARRASEVFRASRSA